jgi:hypothetical protein
MLLTMMGVAGAAPRDGYSAQVSTVQYPRASLYEGLPVDFFETVDELMHNRLAPGSMLKVNIAFERYWKPVAAANGWDEIITTDDPERGGKMATFVLHMLDNTALVADSIGTRLGGSSDPPRSTQAAYPSRSTPRNKRGRGRARAP